MFSARRLLLSAAIAAGVAAPHAISIAGAAGPQIGGSVSGLTGAVWGDRNNDGIVDGYLHNGQYHVGTPAAPAAPSVTASPGQPSSGTGAGFTAPPFTASGVPDVPNSHLAKRWGALAEMAGKTFIGTSFAPSTLTQHHSHEFGQETPELVIASFEWLEPAKKLKIAWSISSGTKWVEIVELGPDSRFRVHSAGVDGQKSFAAFDPNPGLRLWPETVVPYLKGATMPFRYELPVDHETKHCQPYRGFSKDEAKFSVRDIALCDMGASRTWHARADLWLEPYSEEAAARLIAELPATQRTMHEAHARFRREAIEKEIQQAEWEAQSRAENEALGAEMLARNGTLPERLVRVTADATAQNEALRRQGEAAIAEGIARGTAERNRREAAEQSAKERELVAGQERGMAAADEQRQIAEDNEQRRADREREEREQAAQAEVERKRKVEEVRLAELKRAEEERNRPVEWKEGIVLCSKVRPKEWRCDGPLQVTYANLDGDASVPLDQACGSGRSVRLIGDVSGYRAFGCGFGIHPTARDYPGNRDVPATLGVYIPDRNSYYCKRSRDAYCRGE